MIDWQPTNELRWLDVSDRMTSGKRLQQRWRKSVVGHPSYDYEWRDVPTTLQEQI